MKIKFLPSEQSNSKWIMLVLHGLGDCGNSYAWLQSNLELPQMNYLLLDAPNEYFGGFSWYDFEGSQEEAQNGINQSRKMLNALLDELLEKGYPSDHIFLFGFSQGCLMSLETGLRYHQKLAGIIGVSGYINDLDSLEKNVSPYAKDLPLLVTHGYQDPVLSFQYTEKQMRYLKQKGFKIDWKAFLKEHTIIDEEIDVFRSFVLKCSH